MSDRAHVDLPSPELRAAARALHAVCGNVQDSVTPNLDYEAAVRCLFRLLHAQFVDLGWRPAGLTLAPWAVEVVARIVAESDAVARAPKARRKMAKAAIVAAPLAKAVNA